MSLILNAQTWQGDLNQSMALARLIADMESKPRNDVVFLFTHRFDTDLNWRTVEYVHKKFPRTYTYRTTRQGTGWPDGPNAMYADSHMQCIERTRDNSWPLVDGILFMEADCVPLSLDWIDKLKAEWQQTKDEGKYVLGCWLEAGDCGVKHVNGNMIIHTELWRQRREILNPPSGGWDAALANHILPYAKPSRLIYSDYHLGVPGYNDWKGCDYLWAPKRYRAVDNPLFGEDINPVWFHGPKDGRGIDCVRRKFGLVETMPIPEQQAV